MTPRAADLARDDASPLAEPGARMAAAVLDTALPFVPQLVLLVLGAALGSPEVVQAASWSGWILGALVLVVDVVLLARYGQTIGKRIFGLRVVRTSGARASLARLFLVRTVAPSVISAIPLVGQLFGLADALAIFSRDRRTVHDRMADTIVIDLRAQVTKPVADVFR